MSEHVTNRIAGLKRPSAEYPRKFVPESLDFSAWENIKPLFKGLLDRQLDSVEAVEQFLLDVSELGAVISEKHSRRYIAMTCVTDDVKAENAFLHFVENIEPRIKQINNQLDLKLVGCPHTADLHQERYDMMLHKIRNQIELFREENVSLETQVVKLSQQYQKTMAAMTVHFKGAERTMQEMGIFMHELDRSLRKEAFEASSERRLRDSEQMEDIYDKMLELRGQIARNAGFENYRDYQFRKYNRFDYTPEDCYRFHDAVEKFVVPATRKSMEERREWLKIDSVRPWDTICDRYGRDALKPFKTIMQLATGCREIFGRIDRRLGDQFQVMIDTGLLDLGSRKGKAPGGYQSSLSELRLPFIFMNAVGLNRDVFTLLHEGGHAFHQFAVRNEPLLLYRHPPGEFAEVASMSMEKLGLSHLEVFYSHADAARARRESFENDISIMPWIAIVDAYQHWIYTHPGHSRDERSDYFVSLLDLFGSGVDWTGYENARRYSWHTQLHIFTVPFYYIEYGIALLGALQVWQNSLDDVKGAVDAYLAALELGGSRPLPELFKTADTKFDFTENTIKPLMEKVQEEIEKQGAVLLTPRR